MPLHTRITSLLAGAVLLSGTGVISAQENVEGGENRERSEVVEAASNDSDLKLITMLTHQDVAHLKAPKFSEAVSLYDYDVSIENQVAYQNLQQGFGHLMGMWDFQAYRFFLEAVKLEPESLLSMTGLSLALMASDGHLLPQNQVALGRVNELLNAGVGTEFERSFAEGVLLLSRAQLKGWAEKLTELTVSQKEGWLLPALLNAYFSRDGYMQESGSFLGQPREHQQAAIKILSSYCEKRPSDPGPLSFFITAQVDNPNTRGTYFTEILPCARKLVRLYPEFAPYHLLKGYCELRCGDPFLAEESYKKAEELLEAFRAENEIPWRNCKSLIDAKIGRISSYILQENYTEARATCADLRSITLPERGYTSLVASALAWEAETFPLRIACMEGDMSVMKIEGEKLKALVNAVPSKERKLHHHHWESLYHYVNTKSALKKKSNTEANESLKAFLVSGGKVTQGGALAVLDNETMYWSRGKILLSVLENELKTSYELANENPDKANVSTWITNAIDQQEYSRDLMPPLWLFPMETIKADYLYSLGEYKSALREYNNAYNRFPNHIATTSGIEQSLIKLEEHGKAAHIRKIIDKFRERQQ